MYKHFLIPTDGSELSKKAVDHGIGLAKALNAKVTAVTVSEPFHIFAVEPGMVTDTPDEYEKRIAALTGKYLGAAKDAATAAGVPCDVVQVEHEHPYEDYRYGEKERMRRNCDGLPWAPRRLGGCTW
jgi:nucleotide-binding universal stress UspA family protein